MDAPARVERQRLLKPEPSAALGHEAGEPYQTLGEQNEPEHDRKCDQRKQERSEGRKHDTAFCREKNTIKSAFIRRGAVREERAEILDRGEERGETRAQHPPGLRREVERLGADAADALIEPGEIDRPLCRNQAARDLEHSLERRDGVIEPGRGAGGIRGLRGERCLERVHAPPFKREWITEVLSRRRFTKSSAKAAMMPPGRDGVRETTMAESGIGLFDLADKRLTWIDRRQQLLSQNIANADTPGWQPKDLKSFASTLDKSATADLALTNPLHLTGSVGGGVPGVDTKALPEERAPDGNAVAIDEELTKVAQTNDTHALVVNLYQTYLGMFRTALDR